MGRLIFTNKVGNNENKFIVGSTVGRQSKFVRSALNRRASNNSQGLCCDSKNASDVPESLPAPAVPAAAPAPAASAERFMVTVRDYNGNNKYFIDDKRQANDLTFYIGLTYIFDQSEPSNLSHQLRFSNIANGTWARGPPYTDGVATSGTPGSAGASTSITVGPNTPSPLYYYCGGHQLMGGGEITILPI